METIIIKNMKNKENIKEVWSDFWKNSHVVKTVSYSLFESLVELFMAIYYSIRILGRKLKKNLRVVVSLLILLLIIGNVYSFVNWKVEENLTCHKIYEVKKQVDSSNAVSYHQGYVDAKRIYKYKYKRSKIKGGY